MPVIHQPEELAFGVVYTVIAIAQLSSRWGKTIVQEAVELDALPVSSISALVFLSSSCDYEHHPSIRTFALGCVGAVIYGRYLWKAQRMAKRHWEEKRRR